jgi:hypothetical protein
METEGPASFLNNIFERQGVVVVAVVYPCWAWHKKKKKGPTFARNGNRFCPGHSANNNPRPAQQPSPLCHLL